MTHTVENNLLCLLATGTNEAIGKSMLTKDSLKILNKSGRFLGLHIYVVEAK